MLLPGKRFEAPLLSVQSLKARVDVINRHGLSRTEACCCQCIVRIAITVSIIVCNSRVIIVADALVVGVCAVLLRRGV